MGGAEYQLKCLLDKIGPADGFTIYYLTRKYDPALRPESYKIVSIAKHKGIRRYGTFFDVFNLLKLLNKIKPDIIYQRVGCAYTGIAGYYAKQNNCKMVWHIASDSDVAFFQNRKSLSSGFRYIDKKILEYGIKSSCYIIAQTTQQAELLKNRYGRTPTTIIRNFHPLPQERIKKTNPIKIVWVANFKRLKQPEYFIRLSNDLTHVGEKVECIMIGAPASSDFEWQCSLQNEINKIAHLMYLGVLPQQDVNAILAKAHIFVNTSTYEGFPNTFIQAWMRKVPVVSLHCNPDGVLNKQRIGFICDNYKNMLEKVVELIKNPLLRNEMGIKAQTYAFKKHSEKNSVDLIELFKEIST